MIIKNGIKDKQRILTYIASDYSHCLYLFLNIQKYSLDSGVIEVYCQEKENRITAVMLKYYSCLHVYSKDNDLDAEEIGLFFESKGLTMLYSTTATANCLNKTLPQTLTNNIMVSNGWVAQIISVDKEPQGLSVPAQEDDFEQIIRLIYDDEDIGKSYKYDDLARQLIERNREGYARNLVIKQDDLVIAHACTNAELGGIAIVAELLVRAEYRRKGYASEIWRGICSQLLSEGKEVYSFYYTEESRNLHKRIGFFEVCEWSKIVIVN
ncbi:MAG: GNAT family N-acetyltransferase [Bacteroidales bacterium]|nr:GNAT family N-acetyltransferase [Bacteroidales bacterium]